MNNKDNIKLQINTIDEENVKMKGKFQQKNQEDNKNKQKSKICFNSFNSKFNNTIKINNSKINNQM